MGVTVTKWGRIDGFLYEVVEFHDVGHRCGYVEIPARHPLSYLGYRDQAPGRSWDELKDHHVGKRGIIELVCADMSKPPDVVDLFDVHGSLTFAGPRYAYKGARVDWWIGFDCGHAGDAPDPDIMTPRLRDFHERFAMFRDGEIRSADYVEGECWDLIRQIQEYYPARQFSLWQQFKNWLKE